MNLTPAAIDAKRAAIWARARNVLCLRLDALDDVLMTTPALRAVKESAPDRRVTLLTSPAGAAAARLVPAVDQVIVYEAPWMKASAAHPDSRADLALIAHLREQAFDAGVVFTVYSQNPLPAALLLRFADVPLRLAHCRENPYHLLSDWLPEPEPAQGVRHEAQRQLDLVAAVGCRAEDTRLSLRVGAAACQRVAERLLAVGLDPSRPWAVIHPGASAPSRRYPPEQFAAAADALVTEHGWQIVLCGGTVDQGAVAAVRQAMAAPALSLVGDLTLEELGALIALSPLLIANNSGPAHIAAAVGAPVVDLYALTNPQHTPWGVPQRVLSADVPCRHCYRSVCPEGHHRCLRDVPPEAVVQAALDLAQETRSTRPALEVFV